MTEPGRRESDEDIGRRAQEAAWEALDDYRFRIGSTMASGGLVGLPRRPKIDMKLDELEAKLRERELRREEAAYRPKRSRWWHAFWPFGR